MVTLDLGLPPDPDGTSEGFAVLDEIMALKPDTKVIVASGHGARESALTAIERAARSACTGSRPRTARWPNAPTPATACSAS